MNKIIDLDLSLEGIVSNVKRGRIVLFALKNSKGEIGLSEKNYLYPEGIVRLAGGGVDNGESFEQAAVREIEEELQIRVGAERLEQIVDFDIVAFIKNTNEKYTLQIRVYGIEIMDSENLIPSDDITGIRFLNKSQQEFLISNYQNLSGVLLDDEGGRMNWSDYGKLFGPIHEYVFKNYV